MTESNKNFNISNNMMFSLGEKEREREREREKEIER